MKRFLATLMALILTLSAFPALGEDGAETTPLLTVGVTTRMSGFFFTGKWGINAADIDLRELIHGHNTISWELNGNIELDSTVIKRLDAFAEGSDKRFRIALNEDLSYNDGSPITAWDYAFSALLLSSDCFEALGGVPTEMNWFKGYEAYRAGSPFLGVHVTDDYTLELVIDGQFLPFFYEIVLLNITPYPIQVIAPGCIVKDDGQGAYIDGTFEDASKKLEEMRENGSLTYIDEGFLAQLMERIQTDEAGAYPHGLFCEELLRESILNEERGYLHHPTVAAGPYILTEFDLESQTARFVKNPYYAGNFEKVVPTIEEIAVVHVAPDAVLDSVESGAVDMVNKISDGTVIADGMKRMSEDKMRAVNYLRTGLNFISFACELGATQSANVRKAIALCVDRTEVTDRFAQGFAMPVYGYYGLGQWMAFDNMTELEKYEATLDLTEAARLLEADGWTLNEAGEAYLAEAGGVRFRRLEDDTLERLAVNWALPEESTLSTVLEQAMAMNLEAIGMEVTITRLNFEELLAHYYRQTDREYHMFSLATNFNLAFDPYYTFHTGEDFQGESNKTGLQDEKLMALALEMRQTEVGDNEGYVEKWLKFQDQFCGLMPMIPLFSNVYFDFFRTDLQQYNSNAYFSWATAIVYAYIGEPPVEEDVAPEVDDFVIAE